MFNKIMAVFAALALIVTISSYISTAKAQFVKDGLISYWRLDGTTKDILGGNDGIVNGNPRTVDGKIGKALHFDADGDYVDCGNAESLNFERTDTFSVQAWVNKDAENNQVIVGKMAASGKYRGWLFWFRTGGQIGTVIRSDWEARDLIEVNTGEVVSIEEWHHVVMTYDGSSKAEGVKIYVDGIEKALAPSWDALTKTTKTDLSMNFGARDGGSTLYDGIIDEVGIYNRVLDEDEVTQNFETEEINLAVKPAGKLAEKWGRMKASR